MMAQQGRSWNPERVMDANPELAGHLPEQRCVTSLPVAARFAVCPTVAPATEQLEPAKEQNDWLRPGDPGVKAVSPRPRLAVLPKQNCSENKLVEAVATAFFDHYPLDLTPCAVWLAISQGFAEHVKANAEVLRSKFVSHEGQKQIEVKYKPLLWTSPPETWAEAMPTFRELLKAELGEVMSTLTPTLSTESQTTSIATTIVLMDCFQHFFAYGLRGGCGIPSITLRGTRADWHAIRESAAKLRGYDCDWWLDELDIVLGKLCDAADGSPDASFFARILNHSAGSGTVVPFSGWVNAFFPYVKGSGDTWHELPVPQFPGEESFELGVKDAFRGGEPKVVTVTKKHNLMHVCLMADVAPGAVNVRGGHATRDLTTPLGKMGVDGPGKTIEVWAAGTVEMNVPNWTLRAGHWRRTGAEPGEGLDPSKYPSGRSSAPVTFMEEGSTMQYQITVQAGFTHLVQDPATLAVSPAIGWGVTSAE